MRVLAIVIGFLALWGPVGAQEGWQEAVGVMEDQREDLDISNGVIPEGLPWLQTWEVSRDCAQGFAKQYMWAYAVKAGYAQRMEQAREEGWSDVKLQKWEDHWLTVGVLNTKEGALFRSRWPGVPAVMVGPSAWAGAPWSSAQKVVVQVQEGVHAHQYRLVSPVSLYCGFEPLAK